MSDFKFVKTFKNVEEFKQYIDDKACEKHIGYSTAEMIQRSLIGDSTDYDFCGTTKPKGYEPQEITLIVNQTGWRYFVHFRNAIGGEAVLKVYWERGLMDWETWWTKGTMKIQFGNAQEVYDYAQDNMDFFTQFDTNPASLTATLGDYIGKRTKWVMVTIPLDTANWRVSVKYANGRLKVIER